MKKLISLLLAVIMVLGLSVTTMAASSDGVTVQGWNGWTVTDGSAVTTVNPVIGDSVERGTVVKVTDGTAERYFAKQFRGAYEFSVDVTGVGSVAFNDSNGRTVGEATLTDGSINGVSCAYDKDAWNTVKLFVLPGSRKTEIYLGDAFVTTVALTTVVNPTKLIVSSESEIYVDNIVISGMHRAKAYANAELDLIEQTDLSAGMGGWYGQASVAEASVVGLDSDTFSEPVIGVEKKTSTSSSITRLKHSINTSGNFVLEAEMYIDNNQSHTVAPSLSMRCQKVGSTEGRALTLVTFSRDGYPTMGANGVSSILYNENPLYSLGEWFKFKVEVLTESQSMNFYIAPKDSEGDYGSFVRVNKEPMPFTNRDGSDAVLETYSNFLNWEFEINRSASHSAKFYLKEMKVSKFAVNEERDVVFSEDFEDYDPATSRLQHVNTNTEAGSYLTLEATKMTDVISANTKKKAAPSGKVGKMTFSGVGRTGTDYTYHVVDGYQTTEAVNLTSLSEEEKNKIVVPSTSITTRTPDTEYFRVSGLDIRDNVTKLQFKMDIFNPATARKAKSSTTLRGSLDVHFANSTDIADIDVAYTFEGSSAKVKNNNNSTVNKYVAVLTAQKWEKVEGNIYPHGTVNKGAENIQIAGYNDSLQFKSAWITDTSVDAPFIGSLNEMRMYVPSFEGGKYYIDNIEVVAIYPIADGYIRRSYSPYDTYVDIIERGDLKDLELGYVEFKDADGNVGGTPSNGGSVNSISIEKNISLPEGAKLLVGVYEGDVLSNADIITLTAEKTYEPGKTLATTENSVVKVFLWDMADITPLISNEIIDVNNRNKDLVLLGDSIVADYHSGGKENANHGWGEKIGNYVNTNKINIKNYAIGGASSADFLNKDYKVNDHSDLYRGAIESLNKGDYLMISLTTNDESRFSIDKFVANIQEMIDDAKARDAEVILVSSHPRCNYTPVAETGTTRFADQRYYPFGMALKMLAEKNDIYFVDLYQMACDSYDKGTNDAVYSEFYVGHDDPADPNEDDRTHLKAAGADSAASLIAKGVAQTNCSLKDFLIK